MNKLPKALSAKQQEELISALKDRFEKNLKRHDGLFWARSRLFVEAGFQSRRDFAELAEDFMSSIAGANGLDLALDF